MSVPKITRVQLFELMVSLSEIYQPNEGLLNENIVELWYWVFSEYTYQQVADAVKQFLAQDQSYSKAFPVPGRIREYIKPPATILTEEEIALIVEEEERSRKEEKEAWLNGKSQEDLDSWKSSDTYKRFKKLIIRNT